MAIPISANLNSLIQESDTLKFNFEYAFQSENLKAYSDGLFFKLSPWELQKIPEFSEFSRKIKIFGLVSDCITEVDDNVFFIIETGEHVNRYLDGVLIKIEHVHRKLGCFFLNNVSEHHKNNYANDEITLFESMVYLDRANLPKNPNFQLPAEIEFTGTNSQTGTLVKHLHHAFQYLSTCMFIEAQYLRLRQHVIDLIEKHNTNTINMQDVIKDVSKIIPETPLKNLFKDGQKYDAIVSFLIDKGIILNHQNSLIWKGIKANRKIDIVTFCEVLFDKNLLKIRVDDYKNIYPVLMGTFPGFTISNKSFSNKNSHILKRKFNELLHSF